MTDLDTASQVDGITQAITARLGPRASVYAPSCGCVVVTSDKGAGVGGS